MTTDDHHSLISTRDGQILTSLHEKSRPRTQCVISTSERNAPHPVKLADTEIFASQFESHAKSWRAVECYHYHYRRVKVDATVAALLCKKLECHLYIWCRFLSVAILVFKPLVHKRFYRFEIGRSFSGDAIMLEEPNAAAHST
jgi:hypothetical protein